MKETFYLNFCRKHQKRDYYVKILASSYDSAYRVAIAKFGMNWQNIKPEAEFEIVKFRKGQLMQIEGA